MQTGNNKIIFFDLYQTLIEIDIDKERKKRNEAKGWEALAKSLEQDGADISPVELLSLIEKRKDDFYEGKDRKIYHHNLCTLVTHALREDLKMDISEEQVASLLFEYHKIARGYVQLYPGVADTLAELAQRYTLAVASYTQGCYTQPELKELDIEKFFSHFVYTSDIQFRKVSPEFYIRCLEIVGKRPEDCMMIGDNYNADVLVPQNVGMKAIWVKNPITAAHHTPLLNQEQENMINLEDMEKLPEVISRIFIEVRLQ